MRLVKILFFVLVLSILVASSGCSKDNIEDVTGNAVVVPHQDADDSAGEKVIEEIQDANGESSGDEVQGEDIPVEGGSDEIAGTQEEAGESAQLGSLSERFESDVKTSSSSNDQYGGDGAVDIFLVSTSGEETKAKFVITQIEVSNMRGDKDILFKGIKEIYLVPGMKIRLAKKLVDPGQYVQAKIYTDHEIAYVITPDGKENPADFSFDFEKKLDRSIESGNTLAIAFDFNLDESVIVKPGASQTRDYIFNPNGVTTYVQQLDGINPNFEQGIMTDNEFSALDFTLSNDAFSVNIDDYR